jgi:aldehyde dehydrogenase (NAD+)
MTAVKLRETDMTLETRNPGAEIVERVAKARASFRDGRTRDVSWRRAQLEALKRLLKEEESAIFEALWADLRKPRLEGYLTEVGFVIAEIDDALQHLDRWMKPERTHTSLLAQPGKSWTTHDPLGVVLVIGTWNYPVQLLLAPLVGALAGGNAAVLKPSEIAAHTSALMADLLPRHLDPEAVAVIQGGADETQALLDERFDLIFFTGGSRVGQIVLEKAARHLTPVVLELGGKSPCLVDRDASLEVAARRIAWGRFSNAGQTCVAPDYVLVHEAVELELLAHLRAAVTAFYGDDPRLSPDYCRIVNDRNFERLSKLLHDGEVVCGGKADARERYVAPTILRGVSPESPVMQDEIFGPILPVLTVPNMDAAIEFVTDRPKPLALYLFSNDEATQHKVVDRTSSGNACINDVLLHMVVPELPFGGVGESGMGRYHGRWSFETFTHRKGVLARSIHLDLPVRYPPYADGHLALLRLID